jgi:hypothetical protein
MSKIIGPKGQEYDLKVRAPVWGPDAAFASVEISETEWLQIPERITGQVETENYLLTIVTGLDAELRTVIARLTVEQKDGAPGISGDVLNRLGCGDVLKHMVERGSFKWRRDPENLSRSHMVFDSENGEPLIEAPRYAFRSFNRPTAAAIDAQAQEAARLYQEAVAAGNRAPRAHVAKHLHVSPRTATRRLDAARALGYLIEGNDE